MRITFTKLSDQRHAVAVVRADGSSERVELVTREFLRHDLAHYAIESELPIRRGFWGSVAAGAPLGGMEIPGEDIGLAESLAGPVQTLFRTDAPPEAYAAVFAKLLPADAATDDLAARVHEAIRRLRGHWKATPYGGSMELDWPEAR